MTDTDAVREFFEVSFPSKVSRELHALAAREGRVAFRVADAGEWTLRFGHTEPLVPGFDADAELCLWFTRSSFEQLLRSELDVAAAIRAEEITAVGNLSLLSSVAGMLTSGGSSLGWDVG